MGREKKQYSKEFIKYQEDIVKSKNYEGIPFKRKRDGSIGWVARKKLK